MLIYSKTYNKKKNENIKKFKLIKFNQLIMKNFETLKSLLVRIYCLKWCFLIKLLILPIKQKILKINYFNKILSNHSKN